LARGGLAGCSANSELRTRNSLGRVEMSDVLMAAVRCDCGGRLEWGAERTERGPRWTFTCERCGSRWGHRDGVFGPLDRRLVDRGGLSLQECLLLACFRRLPEASRAQALAHLRALARPAGET
jgi:hypothetical protein